jgi:Transposase
VWVSPDLRTVVCEHACRIRLFSEAFWVTISFIDPWEVLMETVVERPGALDVHKEQVTACARVPATDAVGREQHVAEFATTVRGLLALRDWLVALEVTQVTMEAIGVFWKPVWAVLEDEFDCPSVNARHVKQVPGTQDRRQGC